MTDLDLRIRIQELEVALMKIADPELFDLNARAMRKCAQEALLESESPPVTRGARLDSDSA